jgi:hypothetical protein
MISLAQRKYNFIEKYVQINNPVIIGQLERVLNNSLKQENLQLSGALKTSIDTGLKSLDAGKGIPDTELTNGLKQKYPKLRF